MCKENSHVCYYFTQYHEKGNTYNAKRKQIKKLKLYRLAQIMLENTDDEHYITMPEIMEELGKYEVTADRKTIYADLCDLSVLGIEIEGEPHRQPLSLPRSQPPVRTAGIKASGRFHPVFQIHYREEDQHTDKKKLEKAGQQIRCTEAAATGVCIWKN